MFFIKQSIILLLDKLNGKLNFEMILSYTFNTQYKR